MQIHTEFQVDLPDKVADVQAGDVCASTGPPASFIAWAEPDDEEDMEGTSTEQDNDSENVSEVLTSVSNGDESCKEEASTPSPTLHQNTSEECKNQQGANLKCCSTTLLQSVFKPVNFNVMIKNVVLM